MEAASDLILQTPTLECRQPVALRRAGRRQDTWPTDRLVRRFNSHRDAIERCGIAAELRVEIARYAYVTAEFCSGGFDALRRNLCGAN
jgi:hypothetical protein